MAAAVLGIGLQVMKLLCIICSYVGQSEGNPKHEAEIIINGQSVCIEHSGYVQGGDFSLAVARARRDHEERICYEAESRHG